MFEDKNINEFDLMMKSILDEGKEEVPAGVWERVSEGLDKIEASKRKPAAVIWFRRAGIAAAAAAAAIAVGVVLNHGSEEILLPDAEDSSLVAVVEQKSNVEEHIATVEERAEAVTMLADTKVARVRKIAAEIPTTAQEFIENQVTDSASEYIEEAVQEPSQKTEETASAQLQTTVEEERIYFPEDWGEEKESFRPSTSIVLSGLASTNGAQSQNRMSPQKAPVVTPAPEKTGIEETSTRSIYGIPVSAGVGVKIGLSPRWAVGVGANYTMLTRTFYGKYTEVNPDGTIASSTSSDIRNTQHYVGIPVNAYFSIISQDRVSLYAYGGGCAEKCISDDYNVLSTEISHSEKVEGLQFSADAGIGVEFALGKNLGIYIDPSLRYYFYNNQPKSIRTIQPLMFGFEMGLRVNL